ncbi:bifunctional DNA primase/polymerase [Streptomyces collinus]|uniref:bifunctional DNA primase/polymerase n=1 Tax=Streptomyces collinus TaxID=42684 RepID=UPI0036AE0803
MTKDPQVRVPAPTQLPTPRDWAGGAALSTTSAPTSVNLTEQQRAVALTWLSRGLSVIPCSRTDKGPMVAGFGRDASPEQLAPFSDPEQVRQWWSGRFKRAHVGILTGRGADGRGLVVVDLDMRKPESSLPPEYADVASGADVLERLATEAGEAWPDTYTVLTPSGGIHLYFRQPEDGPLIGCATGAGPTAPHLGPLIDVRGVGGLVIAAGSYSAAQGLPYRRASAPDVLPQPLPEWLLERLRPSAAAAAPAPRPAPVHALPTASRPDRYAAAALNGATEDVASAAEGERNRRLFAAARRLGELSTTAPAVLDETTVREQLLAAALRSGQSEREALRTIRSGWERGLAGHGAGAA